VSELLKIAEDLPSESDKVDDTQRKSELLCDLLAQPFSYHIRKCESLGATLSHIPTLIDVMSDETIKDLLINSKTGLSIIKKIKDFAKQLSSSSGDKAEHDVANVIYYAAIAHALVYHQERITTFSCEELRKAFLKLKEENWITKSIGNLYTKVCGLDD
jgi:hypothetical protein